MERFLGVFLIAIVVVGIRVSGVFAKPSITGSGWPERVEELIVVEDQDEGHTCGLHAMSSIYRAFGLDPAIMNLRERLGVDENAIPWVDSTQGVLHTDLLQVASQDGFGYQIVDLDDQSSAVSKTTDCLESQGVALVLVWLEGCQLYHWVVVDNFRKGKLRVVDSLRGGYYEELSGPYLRDEALSVILLKARPRGGNAPAKLKISSDGLAEMLRAHRRSEKRQGSGQSQPMGRE